MSNMNDDQQGMRSGSDDLDAEGMEGMQGHMGDTAAGMGSDTESDLDDDEMTGDTPGK